MGLQAPSSIWRVVLVEDEALVARMLQAWLNQHQDFSVVGTAMDGLRGLEVCRETRPDVAVLDILLPGIDGLTLAERLRREVPEVKIVLLSAHYDPYTIHRIQQLDLPGCVDKSCAPDVLADALQTVLRGERYYSPHYTQLCQAQRQHPDAFHKILSPREIDIVRLLASESSQADIAQRLNITLATLRTHERNIRTKLNLHNREAIMLYARRMGLS